MLADLQAVGVEVGSVWDLVATTSSYRAAVPVLIDWLSTLEQRNMALADVNKLREGLARALTVREARPVAAPALIEAMRLAPRRGPGWDAALWAVGNALAVVADDSVYHEVVSLARDAALGTARQMLMAALSKMKNPAATAILMELVHDPDVGGHAVCALARRRDPAAFATLRAFTDDRRAWVRRDARWGVERLL